MWDALGLTVLFGTVCSLLQLAMIDLRSSEAPQPEAHPRRFTGASKQLVPIAILAFCLFVLGAPNIALQATAGMWLALNPIAWALQRLWGWDRQRFQQLQNEPT